MITAIKDKSIITFTNNENGKLARFDLKDNSCYTYYNNKYNKVKNLNHYFSNKDTKKVIDGFQDEKYKIFINKIWQGENDCSNIGTLLNRLGKYSNLENYILLNISVNNDVTMNTSEINKYIIKYVIERKYTITRTFQNRYLDNKDLILKIIRYINENYDNKRNEEVWDFIQGWLFEYYEKLINTYKYDYKSLLDYIFDYLPNRENYTLNNYNIRDLEDYANMQSVMSKNGKFNKYPRYLKTVHDITVGNYNMFKKEYSDELFGNRIDNKLEYMNEKEKYIIKVPQCCNDVKQEGVQMHNCVGSYIDKIIDGNTQIVFLRNKKDSNKSLATVEIKNNKLCQAFRSYNTKLTEEDVVFLKKYCKAKNIEYKLRY